MYDCVLFTINFFLFIYLFFGSLGEAGAGSEKLDPAMGRYGDGFYSGEARPPLPSLINILII